MRKVLLFISLALSLAACGVPSAPTALPTSTFTPSPTSSPHASLQPIDTSTVTPLAPAPSGTAPGPSATFTPNSLIPTSTVTPPAPPPPSGTAPGPTSTFTPSPAATMPSELSCKLLWQSPSNSASFLPGEKFGAGWKVRNNGTATWEVGSVEFVYLGGAQLHNDDMSQLDTSVAPGQDIILSAAMKAPKNSTKYTTYWGLRQGDIYFCRLKLSIYVIE